MNSRYLIIVVAFLCIALNSSAQTTGTFTDPRDSIVYKWVKIGNQTWMAENLQAKKFRNGDPISNVKVNAKWSSLKSAAYCDYKNSPVNSKIYGRLYNFYAVKDARNIAPEGWHIPTLAEWNTLLNNLGGAVEAAGKLKETGTSHWMAPNTGATNATGFGALPGGCCFGGMEQFYDLGKMGYWWSATSENPNDAAHEIMYNNNNGVSKYNGKKIMGLSIRCVKD
jgi:uncharacterized protein (TIGR02145 family)